MMITIQVLQVPSVIPEVYWDFFLSSVSEERRAQASRFIHQADAYRSVLGEVLTRVTLSEITGIGADKLSFSHSIYGKPCLAQYPDRPFNVSHSGDWVALISGGTDELGVDVEKISPIDLQIAERFFSPQENTYLAAQPVDQQLNTFYRLWTLKESYIKAIGTGLSLPLDSFAILPSQWVQGQQVDDLCWRCTQTGHAELTGKLQQKGEQLSSDAEGDQYISVMPHRFYSQPLDTKHMLAACTADGKLPMRPEVVTLDQMYTKLVEDANAGR